MNYVPPFAGMPRRLLPTVYPLSERIHAIVPTPLPSTVAAIYSDEAIAFFRLDDSGLSRKPKGLAGPEGVHLTSSVPAPFPPVFGRLFGFALKRMLVVFDTNRRESIWHLVCPRFEEVITAIHLLDPATVTLLGDIKVMDEPGSCHRRLRTIPLGALLTGAEAELELGTWPANYTEPVAVAAGTVFRYIRAEHRIAALGPDFSPRPHPLETLFDDRRIVIRLPTELVPHPLRPFALIVDRSPRRNENYAVHLAMWGCDEPRIVPVPFPGLNRDGLYCRDFQLSPDGSWVVYRDESADVENPRFMAMPVVSDRPPYLGPPVVLLPDLRFLPTSTCWTTEPLAFVATDGGAVYRWKME